MPCKKRRSVPPKKIEESFVLQNFSFLEAKARTKMPFLKMTLGIFYGGLKPKEPST